MNERDEHTKALGEWSSVWAKAAERASDIRFGAVRRSSLSASHASPSDYSKEGISERIAITSRRKIVFVNLADVAAVEACCNYVLLRTLDGAHALRQPISAIAEDIEQYGVIRIHRSTIVNGRFVEEIRTLASGKMFVNLKGLKSGYHVSRKYRSALRLFASRWSYGT